MNLSSLRSAETTSPWQLALVGAFVSAPVSVAINQSPPSQITPGAEIAIFGAFVAGGLAAWRSTDPAAAGFCAGLFGALVSVLSAGVPLYVGRFASSRSPVELLPTLIGGLFIGVVVFSLVALLGSICGRIGGWLAIRIWSFGTTLPS